MSAFFPGIGYSQVSEKNKELRDRHRGDPFWSIAFMKRLYGEDHKINPSDSLSDGPVRNANDPRDQREI